MLLNFADSAALIAEPFRWIVAAQFLYQGAGVARDIPREFDGIDAFQNDVVCAHRIGSGERRRACELFELT